MAPVRKILTPKGRPSRPVSEIRAVIRRVAAQAEADMETLLDSKAKTKTRPSSAKKPTSAKTFTKPAHP